MPPIKRSPTPIYNREGVTIYHARCEDVLPTLRPNSFDALITDPPFGIGFKYNEHDDSPEGYGEWLWSVIEQAESKLKPGSPVFVWQAMSNCRRFSEWFPRDYRIFAGVKNFVQMRDTVMHHSYDPVLVWWVPGEPYRSTYGISRDWHVANQSKAVAEVWSLSKKHPCPRPDDQVAYIIRQYVLPGGTILDPFLGSGTTAVCAIKCNRKCCGIEKNREYADLSVERVEDEIGAGFVTSVRKQLHKRGCLKRERNK